MIKGGDMKKVTVIPAVLVAILCIALLSCQRQNAENIHIKQANNVPVNKNAKKGGRNAKSPEAARYHAKGLKLFYSGKYNEALEAWLKELELDPDNPNTMRNIGLAYKNLKNYQTAKSWYRKALSISPKFAKAHYSLGNVYFLEKNYSEAAKEFEEVIRLSPGFPYVHFPLGYCYDMLGKYQLATEQYIEHLKHYPEDYSAAVNIFAMADQLAAKGSYKEAYDMLVRYSSVPVKFDEDHRRMYDIKKKVLKIFQSALIRQDYGNIITALEKILPTLSAQSKLKIPLEKILAYSYLSTGKKASAVRTIKAILKAEGLSDDDRKSLERLVKELTTARRKTEAIEYSNNMQLEIKEYDLGIKSDEDIVKISEFPFAEGGIVSVRAPEARIFWKKENKLIEDYIDNINRRISKLGFYIYDLRALKDQHEFFSYNYDLFKDGRLIVPNLSFVIFPQYSEDGNRFLLRAEQKLKSRSIPEMIYIDTGRVIRNKYLGNFANEPAILCNGRILLIGKPYKEAENILFHFYVFKNGRKIYEFTAPPSNDDLISYYCDNERWILKHDPGRIIIDGVELNKTKGYTDIINYRYLGEKVFYIYRDSSKKYKLYYGGATYPNEYDRVMAHGCCSAGAYNPRNYMDMVTFFATKENKWYYVEAFLSNHK